MGSIIIKKSKSKKTKIFFVEESSGWVQVSLMEKGKVTSVEKPPISIDAKTSLVELFSFLCNYESLNSLKHLDSQRKVKELFSNAYKKIKESILEMGSYYLTETQWKTLVWEGIRVCQKIDKLSKEIAKIYEQFS